MRSEFKSMYEEEQLSEEEIEEMREAEEYVREYDRMYRPWED